VDAKKAAGESAGVERQKKKTNIIMSASVLESGVSHLRRVSTDFVPSSSHPAVERLAVNYAQGTISGARERVYALLTTLRTVVENFEVPKDSTYSLAMTHHLNQVVHVLDKARPMGIAMGNAVRSLKTHLARLTREESQGMCNNDCKKKTLIHIDYFIKEKLDKAMTSIARASLPLIEDGDVIVTHGASKIVRSILIEAKKSGINFTALVVDSRPSNEGPSILSELCAEGIDCIFTALNGLSYAMKHSTKVIIGAAACMSNGVVISRIGSSAVAHAAAEHGIPVFVAAETYKFHERAQLDAFTFNELGQDSSVRRVPAGTTTVLSATQDLPNLSVVTLTYDAISPKCIKSIICEAGRIDPSEVPCYVLAH
jgi:translation initiation factor eIF-2B subunit delta